MVQEKDSSVTMSTELALQPGTVISGRWHKERYIIRRKLGSGANGIVYLVQQAGGGAHYALKLGYDTVDLQSEINILKTLQSKDRRRKGSSVPYLVEVDDVTLPCGPTPFYVMRYIKGEPLSVFISRKGIQWLDLSGLHVLRQLERLHETGYIFGDLKPDNIMVAPYGDAELIDYGGVSQIGRSVKQFTEWYDRGFWNAGSRTADPAYDWFSFSVVCMHLLAGEELKKAAHSLPQTRSRDDLLAIAGRHPNLKPYTAWLRRGLTGNFESSSEACRCWESTISRTGAKRPGFRTPRWLTGAFILSILLLGCALYLRLS